MASTHMLDTNILSNVVRDPNGSVARQLERLSPEATCCSIVVAAELRYGIAKRGSVRLLATVVTDNVREFERVPGLRVENWIDRP